MSCVLWFPLDGTLKNNGLYGDAILTANGVTIDNNGKIGKCYAFNNTNITVKCPSLITLFSSSTQSFSMTTWIYLNSDETDRVIIFGNYNANPFINWELVGNCTQRLCVGGRNDHTTKTDSTVIPKTTWTHIAVTYDGNTTSFYVNGILKSKSTGANTITTMTSSDTFYLGSDTRNDATRLKGKMNDFRLYDHCLSAKEVEEISKGLVLHYSLNDQYVENTTNLLQAQDSFPNPSNGGFSSSNSYQGQYWYISNNNLTTYTASAYVNNTSNLPIQINIGAQRVSDNKWASVAHSDWLQPGENKRLTIIANITSIYKTSGIRLGLMCNQSQTNLTSLPIIQYLQLEEKDHATPWVLGGTTRQSTIAYDSSGYNNNGTIVGSLETTTPSPRYSCATKFLGSPSKISDIPTIFDASTLNSEMTCSFWMKNETTDYSEYRYIFNHLVQIYIHTSGKIYISWNHASGDLSYNTGNSWAPNQVPTLNEWIFIAFTFKDGVLKVYRNGENQNTSDRSSSGQFIRGYKASQVGTNFIGDISDLRLYMTCLSDEQIKELYNTSMAIDNQGNIHARELVE